MLPALWKIQCVFLHYSSICMISSLFFRIVLCFSRISEFLKCNKLAVSIYMNLHVADGNIWYGSLKNWLNPYLRIQFSYLVPHRLPNKCRCMRNTYRIRHSVANNEYPTPSLTKAVYRTSQTYAICTSANRNLGSRKKLCTVRSSVLHEMIYFPFANRWPYWAEVIVL